MTNYEWLKNKIEYLKEHPTTECVDWPFGSHDVYGSVWVPEKQKMVRAHRMAYELANGKAPKRLVLHTCDHHPCINPAHLLDGNHRDNSIDMVRKHRHLSKGRRRLSIADAKQAIEMLQAGKSCTEIAYQFGVSEQTIISIRDYRNWRHLPRPWGQGPHPGVKRTRPYVWHGTRDVETYPEEPNSSPRPRREE